MFDYRNICHLYVLCYTWPVRRNDHGDMDSNRCLRKSPCTCKQNDHSITCTCSCIYQCTIGCNCGMWIDTCSTDSRLQQLWERDVPDIRNSDGYTQWNSNRMRRDTDG